MSTYTVSVSSERAREVAVTYALKPGWIALAAVAAGTLLAGALPRSYQYAPLAVSVLLLGLPHGAVDHLVVARQRGESLTARWLAVVGVVYLLFGGLYGVGWFLSPAFAFGFFILLTWFHWGQGELYPLIDFVGAGYVERTSQKALTVLVRGGAPMLVPLVAFPGEYEFVATTLVSLFDERAAGALAPLFGTDVRIAVGVVYGAALVATIGLGYHRTSDVRPWSIDAGELLGLTAFFLVVPPILAIGVYFPFWHSLRHISRTVLLHDESAASLDRGEIAPAGLRFARDAAPMTAGALVLLGALYLLVPRAPAGTAQLIALYLVLIAMLTLPHVVIVTWLDREQAVFG